MIVISFISLSALFCICSDLAAGVIYQWVDEKGAVHFSDAPPEIDTGNVKVLEVAPVPDGAPEIPSHYYSVTNQARRLEEQRLAREKALAEKRKLQAERRWLEEQQPVDPPPEVPGNAVYAYPAPNFRPFRPWPPRLDHRNREDHPAYRSFRPRHRPRLPATPHVHGMRHWNSGR